MDVGIGVAVWVAVVVAVVVVVGVVVWVAVAVVVWTGREDRDAMTGFVYYGQKRGGDMKPGTLCLLRGGLILRCQGVYACTPGKRRYPSDTLAFQQPSEGLVEPATGYAAAPADVIRVLSSADVPMLRMRYAQARARGLEILAEETRIATDELEDTCEEARWQR